MTKAINPHPSGDPRYDIEVVRADEETGQVLVRYASHKGQSWWVNDDVPEAWTFERASSSEPGQRGEA